MFYCIWQVLLYSIFQANPMVDDLGWKLNGKPLMANKSRNILVRNDSLLIKNVQKQNEGRYECWATNVAGKGESEPIDLNVQCENKFIAYSLHLTCVAHHLIPFLSLFSPLLAFRCTSLYLRKQSKNLPSSLRGANQSFM